MYPTFLRQESGFSLTDLDRYFLKSFEPLKAIGRGIQVKGQAFIHQTSARSIYKASIYAFLAPDDIPYILFFENPPLPSTRPIYVSLHGVTDVTTLKQLPTELARKLHENLLLKSFNDWVHLIRVSKWEEIPLDSLQSMANKIFFKYHSIDNTVTIGYSYRQFQALMLDNIEGYFSKSFYDDFSKELLDGLELHSKEDLLPLVAIASPPIQLLRQNTLSNAKDRAGGFHVALLGKKITSVKMRIQQVTNDPVLIGLRYWNVFTPSMKKFDQYINHPFLSNEYAVLLKKPKTLAEKFFTLPFDYPVQISNAPNKSEELERMNQYEDPDIYNYLAYMRLTYPAISTNINKQLLASSQKVIDWASKQNIPADFLGMGMLFDPNYYGKPDTIQRLALSIARIHDSQNSQNYIPIAEKLLFTVLDSILDQIKYSKSTIYSLTQLEDILFKIIKEENDSYPEGIPIKRLFQRSMWNKTQVLDIIESLARKTRIYRPNVHIIKILEE